MRDCDNWIIRNNSMLVKFIEDKDLKGLIHEVWQAGVNHQAEIQIAEGTDGADIQDIMDELTESINPKNL